MAIDLVAKLRLSDDFSKPMQRAMRSMDNAEKTSKKLEQSMRKVNRTFVDSNGRLREANGRFASMSKNSNKLSGNMGGLSNSMRHLVSFLNPAAAGIAAIGTAAAGAYASVKIFNATVGEAMKMEQSQVVIGAMFNDEKLANQYMKMLDRIAIESPVLDSQGMYANSKAFITASKDIKQLEDMWDLAERLVAIDPVQGLEGAVLALRELFSGDSVSMVERFEMSRDAMNEIKNLSLDKQLTELDKYFNKIGLTTRVIEDMGGTSLGMWAQVKERMAILMRDMGTPSLDAISNFLNNALDRIEGEPMQKFAQWGGKAIDSIVTGLSNGAIKIYDWLTNLTNDPEFQKKTTLTGKVDFIVSDIADKLREWYDSGGREAIMNFGSDVIETLIGVLNNSDKFFQLGANLGVSLSEGIMTGIENAAKETTLGKAFNFLYGDGDYINNLEKQVQAKYDAKNGGGKASSRYHGIDYVPKNNWKADLHKGEAVLPAQEAKAWREGKSGGVSVSVTGNTFNVRQDSDIDAIATALADRLERKAMQRG